MCKDGMFDMEYDDGSMTDDDLDSLMKKGIMAVLQKCREKLEEANVQGIESDRNNEGKKVVDTFLREMEAATSLEELAEDSILQITGMKGGRRLMHLSQGPKGLCCSEKFPNFIFKQTSVFFTGEISPEGEFFLPLAYFWRNLDPKKTFLSPKIHLF
jgi:hypothetical protein